MVLVAALTSPNFPPARACRFVQIVLLWAAFVEVLANLYDSEKGTEKHQYGNFELYEQMFALLRMLWATTNA